MAEVNNNGQKSAITTIKKNKKSSAKTVIIAIASCLVIYVGANYFDGGFFNTKSDGSKSVGDDIFEISKDHTIADEGNEDFSSMDFDEFKERAQKNGIDFLYRAILKNQILVNDLKGEINTLKAEMARYKNKEYIARIVFSYVGLREELFSKKPKRDYSELLKNFETLSQFNSDLKEKTLRLKTSLKSFNKGPNDIVNDFQNLIPYLVAAKNNNQKDSLFAEFKVYLSRLVTIRKLDSDTKTIDGLIVNIEAALSKASYYEALILFSSLQQQYIQQIGGLNKASDDMVSGFLDSLSQAARLQEIDQDIMNYLKNLSQ